MLTICPLKAPLMEIKDFIFYSIHLCLKSLVHNDIIKSTI